MTETTAACGRCSRTIEDSPIGVSVDGGPLRETDPVLGLCPECAASLARWLERGRRRTTSSRPMVQEPKDADDSPRHRKNRSREEVRRQRDRKTVLRKIALITLLVAVNVLVVMLVIKFVNSPAE